MADAKRDNNVVTTLIAVSSADGITPVVLWADPTTHRLLVDTSGSGASTALDNLASVAINTALLPGTSDSIALGSATKMWSDLFLGADAVINFNNGDVTLTHGSNVLTLGGGNLALGTNSLTMTGSIGATGARVTKLWATDIESTNMPTVGGTSLSSTFSPIAGSASIVTVGTIGTGVWQGTTIKANYLQQAPADLGDADITVDLSNSNVGNVTNLIIDGALTIASFGGNWTNAGRTVADLGTITTADINGGSLDGVTIGGASAAGATVTTLVVNTSALPDADDGAPLGASGTGWSDLFLASGAVINFAAGAVIITHSVNTLTLAGSAMTTLAIGAVNLTMTGSIAATGARVTKGWFTDLEVTNDITINGTALATTYLAKAGGTLTGSITLGENTGIALDPAGSADGKWSGVTITGTGGATIAFGRLVYLKAADSQWYETDADALATAGNIMIGMTVTTTTDNNPVTILLLGQIRADASFPALTVGAAVYAGETAGDIQVAIPTGADNVIRVVGFALTADEIYFNPSQDHQTTVA